MIFWTRGRRLLTAVILVVLAATSLMIGFFKSEHAETRVVAVDLRTQPDEIAVEEELKNVRRPNDLTVVFVLRCQVDNSCPATETRRGTIKRPTYKTIKSSASKAMIISADQSMGVPQLLPEIYGADIAINPHGTNVFQATRSSFNQIAAITAAALLVPAFGLLIASLRTDGGAPAPREVPQHHQPPQPRTAGVPMQRKQPARTISVEPSDAAPLQPLVASVNGAATACSHVTDQGGYVALGDVVVWAVLQQHAIASPGEPLAVVEVDGKNEALVVTSSERGSRP